MSTNRNLSNDSLNGSLTRGMIAFLVSTVHEAYLTGPDLSPCLTLQSPHTLLTLVHFSMNPTLAMHMLALMSETRTTAVTTLKYT